MDVDNFDWDTFLEECPELKILDSNYTKIIELEQQNRELIEKFEKYRNDIQNVEKRNLVCALAVSENLLKSFEAITRIPRDKVEIYRAKRTDIGSDVYTAMKSIMTMVTGFEKTKKLLFEIKTDVDTIYNLLVDKIAVAIKSIDDILKSESIETINQLKLFSSICAH